MRAGWPRFQLEVPLAWQQMDIRNLFLLVPSECAWHSVSPLAVVSDGV